MAKPYRVQLSRSKGWRMPENTVSVARPGRWGNPTRVIFDKDWNGGRINALDGRPIVENGPWLCALQNAALADPRHVCGIWFKTKNKAAQRAVDIFRLRVEELAIGEPLRVGLPDLRGKNLACWCPLDAPCHADVLLELANGSRP